MLYTTNGHDSFPVYHAPYSNALFKRSVFTWEISFRYVNGLQDTEYTRGDMRTPRLISQVNTERLKRADLRSFMFYTYIHPILASSTSFPIGPRINYVVHDQPQPAKIWTVLPRSPHLQSPDSLESYGLHFHSILL
jgi:hypothetical protein